MRVDLRSLPPLNPRFIEALLQDGRIEGQYVVIEAEDLARIESEHFGAGAAPQREEPTLTQLAKNFLTATSAWTKAGFPVVSADIYARRAGPQGCGTCPHWEETARFGLGRCNHPSCGCTRLKRWLSTEKCPLQRW